ncbi:MAG: glycosyltransferase [Phycisphaerae bacterium]|nr:MAG: glycosyltransferase [Planctomycetota bacterium]KAB2949560.1 MAG: glycosyltransferase [Phycisphaerae bacterium]MBE7455840.1 glycosyltransferase [Planctomycetia bacterium]MCK6463475.1 glycosyltransferase [Phycisphaerae bacterium]MCL4717098.1 glycosyltransferase [Phycisphaerae bacterium]
MLHRPRISVVIATYNRKEAVLETLQTLPAAGIDFSQDEIFVVDNGSTDGTREALARLAGVRLILAERNFGSCAKAIGADHTHGEFLLFLDDDARPREGSIEAMLAHFAAEEKLGAAAFVVQLPDGRRECSALPGVFAGTCVGFRAWAYRQVGGLDRTFFMQAEEYDLSFRLLNAGWRVATFEDLVADHLKTSVSRDAARTTYYDVCNNLRVIGRYLPPPLRAIYRRDWMQRYRWIAERHGHLGAFWRGALAGRWRSMIERREHLPQRLSATAVEDIFALTFVRTRFERLREQGVRRVILADLGKNLHAFHAGARESGVDVLAVADDFFTGTGRAYRGTPIITTAQALTYAPDAFVVSNTSYVHAQERYRDLVNRTSKPVYNWFDGPETGSAPPISSTRPREAMRRSIEAPWTASPPRETFVAARTPITVHEAAVGAWAE